MAAPLPVFSSRSHVDALKNTLMVLRNQADLLDRWGRILAERLPAGRRLLVAGNGGSAAEAQHLSAELVGRFDADRPAFSAIALHADTSSLTAIGNDYGYDEVFARQVRAHAHPGDVLMVLSTSGRSRNLLRAVEAAHECRASAWAMTGPGPNPLTELADESVVLTGAPASVQEAHLVAVHMICRAFDAALPVIGKERRAS